MVWKVDRAFQLITAAHILQHIVLGYVSSYHYIRMAFIFASMATGFGIHCAPPRNRLLLVSCLRDSIDQLSPEPHVLKLQNQSFIPEQAFSL